MLPNKGINKISELKTCFTHSWVEPDFIKSSLKSFTFSSLCKALGPFKLRGYSFESIFTMLLSLPFLGIETVNSMYNHYLIEQTTIKKDVFYRMKNNPGTCWRVILWLFACKFRDVINDKSTQDSGSPRCFIVDDSTLPKSGRLIEKVSYVWDHVSRRSILGFKLLVAGYWDGTSFIPLDFSLHREKGKNKERPYGLKKKYYKKQHRSRREKGSHSYDRSQEADNSKIESAINMFRRTISQGFKVEYALMDSWFTCEAFIDAVKRVKNQTVHLIGMYSTPKTLFNYCTRHLTHSQIRNTLGKPKRCRKLHLYYQEVSVEYKGYSLKLFYSKQGTNGKWHVILTTDTDISFIKMIEIYQIRWSIEVFFKESKQLLSLGRCQSNNFDAHIADITMTMIQYILISMRYRFDTYETKWGIFKHISEQTIQYRLSERLWGLFIELLTVIEKLFEGIDEMELIEKIMSDDEAFEIICRILPIKAHSQTAA